jgi:hypothetical protein
MPLGYWPVSSSQRTVRPILVVVGEINSTDTRTDPAFHDLTGTWYDHQIGYDFYSLKDLFTDRRGS